jgi:hypothetical protein
MPIQVAKDFHESFGISMSTATSPENVSHVNQQLYAMRVALKDCDQELSDLQSERAVFLKAPTMPPDDFLNALADLDGRIAWAQALHDDYYARLQKGWDSARFWTLDNGSIGAWEAYH